MNKLTAAIIACLTLALVASDVYGEWYTLQESAKLERLAKTATARPDHWRVYVGVNAIEWTACGVNDDRAVIPCTTYIGIPPRHAPYVDNDDSDESADKLTTARVWQRLNDTAASFDASANPDAWCHVMVECDTDSDCESKNGGDGY